jgi:hypothetical protein
MGKDIVILSPYMGGDAIRNLGLPPVPPDSYIAVDIRDQKERQIIEQSSQTRKTKEWAASRPRPKGPIERIPLREHQVQLGFTDDVDPDFDKETARSGR